MGITKWNGKTFVFTKFVDNFKSQQLCRLSFNQNCLLAIVIVSSIIAKTDQSQFIESVVELTTRYEKQLSNEQKQEICDQIDSLWTSSEPKSQLYHVVGLTQRPNSGFPHNRPVNSCCGCLHNLVNISERVFQNCEKTLNSAKMTRIHNVSFVLMVLLSRADYVLMAHMATKCIINECEQRVLNNPCELSNIDNFKCFAKSLAADLQKLCSSQCTRPITAPKKRRMRISKD